jgi:hypothetical protein
VDEQVSYFWEPEEALQAMRAAGWNVRGLVGDCFVGPDSEQAREVVLSFDLLCDPEGAVCCIRGLGAHEDVYADPDGGMPTPHQAVHILKNLPR